MTREELDKRVGGLIDVIENHQFDEIPYVDRLAKDRMVKELISDALKAVKPDRNFICSEVCCGMSMEGLPEEDKGRNSAIDEMEKKIKELRLDRIYGRLNSHHCSQVPGMGCFPVLNPQENG